MAEYPGGPPGFERLAMETGGHVAKRSNDLTLGYAIARRDLSCRYTLGFYDNHPEEERSHNVSVEMERGGLRAYYPGGYAFRSSEKKREALLLAAFIAPAMFESGVVRTHVFPVRPRTTRTWDCTVAVEFPLPAGIEKTGTVEQEFGVIIRKGSEVVHSFDRKVTVRFKNLEDTTRRVSFSQPVELAPGAYSVAAVMTAADRERPYTASAQVVVPPIPKGEAFLVPPVLGKPAVKDVVVRGGASREGKSSDELAKGDRVGDANSFMPLLVQSVGFLDPVLAMTQACLSKKRGGDPVIVSRTVESEAGETAFAWQPSSLTLTPQGGMECQPFLDEVPILSLLPGDYTFKASLSVQGEPDQQPHVVPFTLQSPTAKAAQAPAP